MSYTAETGRTRASSTPTSPPSSRPLGSTPPPHGAPLDGPLYRLPFGYQMDTSYFYYRLKWQVPCGPNSILTFPGSPLLKPWFWWGWPLLPFGITWHRRRGEHIG